MPLAMIKAYFKSQNEIAKFHKLVTYNSKQNIYFLAEDYITKLRKENKESLLVEYVIIPMKNNKKAI